MTKAELLKKLAPFPDEMEVLIPSRGEFEVAPIESVKKKKVPFAESPGGKALAKEECIVLDEEM